MFSYEVQPGDTLNKIADYFDVSIQDILSANPFIDPNNLIIGQIIRIPISRNLYQDFPWYYLFPYLFIRHPRSYWTDRTRWPRWQPGRDGWPGRGRR